MGHFTNLVAELQIIAGIALVVGGLVGMYWAVRGHHAKAGYIVLGMLIGLFLIGLGVGQKTGNLETFLANTFTP